MPSAKLQRKVTQSRTQTHRISKSSTIVMLAINSICKRPESQYLDLNYYCMRTFPSFDNAFPEPKWGAVSNRACL